MILQRMFRQTVLSNQFNWKFPRIFDSKWFCLSSTQCKVKSGLRPLNNYNIYYKMTYKRLKEEHPSLKTSEICQAIAEEWKQLSEAEKRNYSELYKDKMKEYEADGTIQELEKIKNEINELLHDRPSHCMSNMNIWNFYFAEVMTNSKGKREGTINIKNVKKEWESMNEKERSAIQKRFDATRQELDKWKHKIQDDGRAEILRNIESSLSQRLKSLESDKPKFIHPHICYFQQNFKFFQGFPMNKRMQELSKKWKSLSAEEKEPYYESLNKYHADMPGWKETTSQDGRMAIIQAIKKLLYHLKI